MSRSERLLSLLETLRLHRHAVSGQTLAQDLGVSLRTVYRDIASLQQQGALIEGSRAWALCYALGLHCRH
jgi:predicted DNA-binding transcriptional regulator YafY